MTMIDWTRVTELEQEIGADSLAEVLDLFLSEVEGALAGLAPAGDRTDLESQLHFLKGAALNLSFAEFSVLCQTGESMSAQGRAAEVELVAITASFHASYVRFQAELAQRDVA